MPRDPSTRVCNDFGSTLSGSGNLPQWKVDQNPCGVNLDNITYPITSTSFRYHHIKCPFSTQSSFNKVLDLEAGSATYFQMIDIPYAATDHVDTSGIMIKEAKGTKWGWLCVEDNCPYYLATGRRYFYT